MHSTSPVQCGQTACKGHECGDAETSNTSLTSLIPSDIVQVQLLKIYVARELARDVGWVEEQLRVLRAVLPSLVGQVHRMKASLLLGLVRDTQVT